MGGILPAKSTREVLQQREKVDQALAEQRHIYNKQAQDVQSRGNPERERPAAGSAAGSSAPTAPPGVAGKRLRSNPVSTAPTFPVDVSSSSPASQVWVVMTSVEGGEIPVPLSDWWGSASKRW